MKHLFEMFYASKAPANFYKTNAPIVDGVKIVSDSSNKFGDTYHLEFDYSAVDSDDIDDLTNIFKDVKLCDEIFDVSNGVIKILMDSKTKDCVVTVMNLDSKPSKQFTNTINFLNKKSGKGYQILSGLIEKTYENHYK